MSITRFAAVQFVSLAIAPHWHSMDERVTVLSGALNVGMGDKLARSFEAHTMLTRPRALTSNTRRAVRMRAGAAR